MRFLIHAMSMTLLASPPIAVPAQSPAAQPPMSLSILAQTVPAQVAPPQGATVQAAPAPLPSRPPRARRTNGYRQTLAERFEQANASKDGHLTQSQATAARWSYITRNFDAIDKDHKGYVTTDDIRGYARDRRAARAQQTREPALPGRS